MQSQFIATLNLPMPSFVLTCATVTLLILPSFHYGTHAETSLAIVIAGHKSITFTAAADVHLCFGCTAETFVTSPEIIETRS